MKWFACVALLTIGISGSFAEQNKEFQERAEIYSSNMHFNSQLLSHKRFSLSSNSIISKIKSRWAYVLNPKKCKRHDNIILCSSVVDISLFNIFLYHRSSRLLVHLMKPVFVHINSTINYKTEHNFSEFTPIIETQLVQFELEIRATANRYHR